MDKRIHDHPVLGPRAHAETVTFHFATNPLQGYDGEPIAAALLSHGVRVLRRHEESGTPRGLYCAIGHCMECRVHVQGMGVVRACITPLREGMRVTPGDRLPNEITGRK